MAFVSSCYAAQMRTDHEVVPGVEVQASNEHLRQARRQAGQENTVHYLLVLKAVGRASICSWEVRARAEAQEGCSSARVPMVDLGTWVAVQVA